jgi:hypothetical protein
MQGHGLPAITDQALAGDGLRYDINRQGFATATGY